LARLSTFLFILFFLNSCGSPLAPKATKRPKVLILKELSCEAAQVKESLIANEMIEYSNQVFSYVANYNNRFSPAIRNAGAGLKFRTDPLNPLVLGEKIIKEKLKVFKGEVFKKIGSDFKDIRNLNLSNDERIDFEKTLRDLLLWRSLAQRWSDFQCSLPELVSRQEKDVRTFYQAENNQCDDLPFSHCGLKLCIQEKSLPSCLSELTVFKRKKQGDKFSQIYRNLYYQKKIKPFFSLTKNHKKWSCLNQGDEEGMRLIIPFFWAEEWSSRLNLNFLDIKKAIEEKWKSKDLKIEIRRMNKMSERTVSIVWESSNISYVKSSSPLIIHLSQNLYSGQLLLTLVHEFGHVLGFPDCYVEFYNSKRKELTYYSLEKERSNLMCNMEIEEKVPEDYLKQLRNQSCL
jgi:hypothetical protein